MELHNIMVAGGGSMGVFFQKKGGGPGADLRIDRGGGGVWQEFFKGGLGSKAAGIFIYWQAKR